MKKRMWILVLVLLGLLAACTTPVTLEPNKDTDGKPVLTWQREGGIAGFCDGLIVYADGRVSVTTCTGKVVDNRMLSPDQQAQLATWVNRMASFDKAWADPAVADAMTIRVVFAAVGDEAVAEVDMGVIRDFSAEVYASFAMETGELPPNSGMTMPVPDEDGALDPVQNEVKWEDAVALILEGEVQQVTQTHALEVTLTLRDGADVKTIEPIIDEVFTVIDRCGDPCKDMVLATE